MPVTASDWSRWRDVEQWVQACVSTKIKRVTLFDSSKHNPTFLGNTKTPPAALSSDNKKAMTDNARHGEWLVEVTGLEPTASASRTQRSTKLSHTSKYHCNIISHPSNLVKAFFSVLYPLCSFLLRWPLVYDEFIEIILIVTYFHWHTPCVVILYI